MKQKSKKVSMIALIIIVGIVAGVCSFMRQPKFGRMPDGSRLGLIEQSPNHEEGEFRYPLATPRFTGGTGFVAALWEYIFTKYDRLEPSGPFPTVKTDLKSLDGATDTLIWFGHSSLLLQLGGKTLLIDPVFSPNAAPFSFSTKAFTGTNIYTSEDMPAIDYILISHDHWDHLDYPTIMAFKAGTSKIICGLGVGAHLEYWGVGKDKIMEADWGATLELGNGFKIHTAPARHSSGRSLTRNKTLWTSFVLETPNYKLFYSGDGGYGPHFAELGQRFSGFNLALLDVGQYDKDWMYSHMTPEEGLQAMHDLQAKALIPVHVGKFALAKHPWDEPFRRLQAAARGKELRLLTPMIGELVHLKNEQQQFSAWWEAVE